MENLVDINKLVKVSTYARNHKPEPCSSPWVYQLAKQGKVEIITIDKVNFVKL